jgi:hypothetical protein
MGVPIRDGAFGIYGEYSTTEGADGFGGSVTANLNGPISLQAGYTLTTIEDLDENANFFHGRVAYEFPNMSFSVCPIAGASYGTWSDEAFGVEADASELTIPIGLGVGRSFTRGPVDISLYAIPQFLHIRGEVTVAFGGNEGSESESTNEFGAELGARVGTSNIWGGAGFFFTTLAESDLVFSIGIGIAIGGR